MSTSYTWTSNAVIQELEREKTLVLDQNSVFGQLMPWTEEDADTVLWEIRDNVKGLMPVRGSDEPFPRHTETGIQRFAMQPGRFGEEVQLSEQKIERMRRPGTFADALDVTTEAAVIMDEIAKREFDLVEYSRARLLVTGVLSVPNDKGELIELARYSGNTLSAGTPWTTVATATPIGDLRTLRDTYAGLGYDFGYRARAFASSKTWNSLLGNTNANDFAGRRGAGLTPINGITMFNTILSEAENIPQLVAVDDGYLDTSGVFQRYIPDGKILVVGFHLNGRGLQLGNYVSTRVGANKGRPGTYAEIYDSPVAPKLPLIVRGHNGGPRVNYGNQAVVFTAYS